MNICFLVGNLTAEPQKIEGTELVRFAIAVHASYTKADGSRPTDYFNIVVWGNYGDNCMRYLHKGSKVAVSGRIQNRAYERNGVKQIKTEIVATDIEFLNPKPEQKPNTNLVDAIFEEYNGDCPF